MVTLATAARLRAKPSLSPFPALTFANLAYRSQSACVSGIVASSTVWAQCVRVNPFYPTSERVVTRHESSESPVTYAWSRPTDGEHPDCDLAHEATYARFNGRVHHSWTGDRHSRLVTLGRE